MNPILINGRPARIRQGLPKKHTKKHKIKQAIAEFSYALFLIACGLIAITAVSLIIFSVLAFGMTQ